MKRWILSLVFVLAASRGFAQTPEPWVLPFCDEAPKGVTCVNKPAPPALVLGTKVALATQLTLQGIDLAQSMYVFGAGYGHELNPALAPLQNNPVAFGGVKMGIAVGTGWAILELYKRHPHDKHPLLVLLAENAFYGYVIWSNNRIIAAHRGVR